MENSHKEYLINLLLGPVVARAIYTAADLNIADLISQGIKNVEKIAEKIDAHPPSLYRLLRMLSGRGFFKEENGQFSLMPLGKCLLSDHPDSLKGFICKEDESRWRSVGKLKSAVLNGFPAFDQIYGKNYFEYLAADSEMNSRFDEGMSSLTMEEDKLIAKRLPLNGIKTLVDVGGGKGGFISEILKINPSITGTLFELPHVVSSEELPLLSGVEKRCGVVSGSFFETVPPGKDVYLLKRILHDWDAASCIAILKNCKEALCQGGKILVVEGIVPEDNAPSQLKDVDVYMMCLFPGKERTEKEFCHLAHSAGLQITSIIPTPSLLSIIQME